MGKKSVTRSSGLVYNGGGHGGSFDGIPARDLTPDEVKIYGGKRYLLGLGIYEDTGSPADVPKDVAIDDDPEMDQEVKDGQ